MNEMCVCERKAKKEDEDDEGNKEKRKDVLRWEGILFFPSNPKKCPLFILAGVQGDMVKTPSTKHQQSKHNSTTHGHIRIFFLKRLLSPWTCV